MRLLRTLVLVILALCTFPGPAKAYVNAGTGRFLSRDSKQEQGGPNLFGFVENDPANAVDPLGLSRLDVAFDAFINGARRGAWLTEPFVGINGPNIFAPSFVKQFSTDPRDFGQFNFSLTPPNARVASMGWLESTAIGTAQFGISAGGRSATGISHRRFARQHGIGDPQFEYGPEETGRAPISNPIATVINGKCESWLRFRPSASYPFLPGPAIHYNIDVHFKVAAPGWVTITFEGNHNAFPDYEAYVGRTLVYSRFSPHAGPSPFTLGAAPWSGHVLMPSATGMSMSAPTPSCCP